MGHGEREGTAPLSGAYRGGRLCGVLARWSLRSFWQRGQDLALVAIAEMLCTRSGSSVACAPVESGSKVFSQPFSQGADHDHLVAAPARLALAVAPDRRRAAGRPLGCRGRPP